MGGRGASSASSKVALALPPADLHDFTGDAQQLKHVANKLRSSGQYAPWSDEKISEQLKSSIISKWKGSSSYVRHNVQYKDGKTGHGSQMFDDWLNSGAYEKTIYRGTRMTDSEYAKISSLSKGQLVNQNGPASFSKSESVAKNFAKSGYNVGKHPVVFVLQGGTRSGQDISGVHGYASEKEVCVGSASNMRVSRIEHKSGITYVYGKEVKVQYVPHTTH